MLADLDSTLETLLQNELPPALVSPKSATRVTISFDIPDREFPNRVSLPAMSLFLYDIRENLELRNAHFGGVERQSNGTGLRRNTPVRVDCSYLITVWPGRIANPERDEHRILGEVMQVLLRYREIPSAFLQGRLVGHEPPLRAFALRQSKLNSLGEFWQAMGGTPRAALHYTLTSVMPTQVTPEAVPLVLQTTLGREVP